MSAGNKPLFPLFWKAALFFCAAFAAAFASALFAARAGLAPQAERNARVLNGAANYNAALMAATAFDAIKSDTDFFARALAARGDGAEQNALTYAFYAARPDRAAVVIDDGRRTQKILNIGMTGTRLSVSAAVDAFLAARAYDVERAADEGGILNATPFFNRSALAYAARTPGGARYCGFFFADGLAAAFESGSGIEGGQAFLTNRRGEILFHSDSALARAAARFDGASYVTDLLAGPEESGSRVVRGAKDGRHFASFRKLDSGALLVHTFPLQKPLDDINAAFLRGLFLGLAFLCAGLFILRLLSKTVTGPVAALTRAADALSDGNFDVALKGGPADEVGRLVARFSRMACNLRAASAFADAPVVRAFLRGEAGGPLAKKNAVVAGARVANLADIKKRTSAAELGEYVSRFIEIIHEKARKTNGTAGAFSEGFVACHWGCAFSTGSRNHDTMNAVRALLMARLAFAEFNRVQKAKKKPPLICAFSIDAGVVSAGVAGGDGAKEYAVFGNAVKNAKNLALLSDGAAFDILISEKIYLRARGFMIAEQAAGVDSGGDNPVFSVINIRTAEGVTQPVPRNAAELRKLLDGDYEDTDGAA